MRVSRAVQVYVGGQGHAPNVDGIKKRMKEAIASS